MNRMMRFAHDWIASQGHEVVYLSSEDVPDRGRFRRRFQFPWAVYQAAVAGFREGRRFDVVNVHEPQSAVIASWRVNAGNPYVVATSHGSEHRGWELAREEVRLGRTGPSLMKTLLNPATRLWQCKLGLSRSDHVFCLNEEDRDYFVRRLAVAPEKITRITPGANDVYRQSSAARLGRPATRLIFVGSWHKNKGIEDLVPAFVSLARQNAELTLTILGAGVTADTVMREFPAEVRERISVVQTNGDQENAQLLEQSDIFVLPSIFEGTPLSLMEAMASALPVVTTSTCGMRDVIKDGENGLLVPMRSPERVAEAVQRLVSDPQLRRSLGERAQKDTAERFTWRRSGETILSAYEKLRERDGQWIWKRWPAAPSNKSPMKFCFVADFLPEWNTGAAGSILAIGKELERMGHSVHHQWKKRTLTAGINFNLGHLLELPRIQLRQVRQELLESKPDVVIISQPFAYRVYEQLAPQHPDTLFLNLTHGWEHRNDIANRTFGWGDDFSGLAGLKRRVAMASRARVCGRTARAMDGFLSPCSADGQFVARTYDVPQKKLLLLTYGLDEELLAGLPERPSHGGLRMLFYGQYSPGKGSLILERILPTIGREYRDAEITFIVPNTELSHIEAIYGKSFGDRLHAYGWMNRSRAMDICRNSDVMLFPSMMEGFGKAFLEGMGCGLCVVGYAEGGLPDIAVNEMEALYCGPNERKFEELLRRCLQDPDLAREIGTRARAKAVQFTWRRTAERLQAYCMERLAEKKGNVAEDNRPVAMV
jgi:glycosyltransferase involved in cell wall biosynthesis